QGQNIADRGDDVGAFWRYANPRSEHGANAPLPPMMGERVVLISAPFLPCPRSRGQMVTKTGLISTQCCNFEVRLPSTEKPKIRRASLTVRANHQGRLPIRGTG